ncbi:MAG: TRIC cation channel family protein [Lachnospiraceae bacterium]
MNYTNTVIFIFEIIGTIAFASSGALVGIRKNMDLLGVNVLGITTAVGGGLLRDLILGIHPPKMFQNYAYVAFAILTSCILFLIVYANKRFISSQFIEQYERAMTLFDAVGLGVFTVIGINTAIELSFEHNTFLLLFVGVITGIGGGVLRDIMAGTTPFVFVKQIYASASILGAVAYVILLNYIDDLPAMFISALIVFTTRMLAAYFKWNLPRI